MQICAFSGNSVANDYRNAPSGRHIGGRPCEEDPLMRITHRGSTYTVTTEAELLALLLELKDCRAA